MTANGARNVSGNEPLEGILTGVYSPAAQRQPTPQPFPIPARVAEVKTGVALVPDILRTMLFIPGAVVAAFVSPAGQIIVARGPLSDAAPSAVATIFARIQRPSG